MGLPMWLSGIHLPMQETWVQSLGQEDTLAEEMASHFSIPVWRNPMDRGIWWATVQRVTKNQDMHIFYIYNQNGGGDRYLFLIFNLWYSFVVGLSFLRHFSRLLTEKSVLCHMLSFHLCLGLFLGSLFH